MWLHVDCSEFRQSRTFAHNPIVKNNQDLEDLMLLKQLDILNHLNDGDEDGESQNSKSEYKEKMKIAEGK